MNVVGVSALYHDAACCLLRDGVLVAAVEEERCSRIKHDARLPVQAFRECLCIAGLDITEVDVLAWYEQPQAKRARQLACGHDPDDARLDASAPERALRELLGWEGPVHCVAHHAAHAASAYYLSGFDTAAVLTADGVGEWASTSYGIGTGAHLECFAQVDFPHSLGLLYAALTAWLGFAVNDGEYKVMGLAPYGQARHLDALRRLVDVGNDGDFRLDLRYFDFIAGGRMYTPALTELLGLAPRLPGEPITQDHCDVARSVQALLEEILLHQARWLHARTGMRDLCLAGGVALNVVANGRLLRETPFERLFVPPAPGDSGACIGAAALAHVALSGARPSITPAGGALQDARLGPRWSAAEAAGLVRQTGLPAQDFRGREQALLEAVVDRLAAGQVIGWFHGPLEFGPRALGGRSLIADPRVAGMRDRINAQVKQREAFRPFAPSVLASRAQAHFDLPQASPFMAMTCAVRSPLALPAITHVDGSARPQTVDPSVLPRYAALLAAFEARTGCPLLLNTSFNLAGEPMVASPEDALYTFAAAGLDALVLEDQLIDASALDPAWRERVLAWRQPCWERSRRTTGAAPEGLRGQLYSFV